MKKVDYILVVALIALCLLIVVGYGKGTVESQTSAQPAASTPAVPTPAVPTPTASVPAADISSGMNRPMSEWAIKNMVFLNTLIGDSKLMLSYLMDSNLAYAEIACPQLRCDIATMRGLAPPRDALASSRALRPAPSGYRCPPIPDAQAAADLNVGMAQLESAIYHIITGENTYNGELIRLGESETKAACDTFAKVLTDIKNIPNQETRPQPATSTPFETIQSFFAAVQAGDMDFVSLVTGGTAGKPGIPTWCSKGLESFVGHTTFKPFRYVLTHNDDLNANVNGDAFMTFTDPAGFPAVVNTCHFYIDGDFKLKAIGGKWIIVALPNFQEAHNDGPSWWGSDPFIFPYPGNTI